MNKDFRLPKEALEQVSEYVQKGIAASKQSESEFYGEFKHKMEKVSGEFVKLNDRLDNHESYFKRMEPVIKKFEEDKIFVAGAKKIASTTVVIGGGISVLSGAWYIIKHWIINLK